jgi:hypothetical protein
MIREPSLRYRLGETAEERVRQDFDYHNSIGDLKRLFSAGYAESLPDQGVAAE